MQSTNVCCCETNYSHKTLPRLDRCGILEVLIPQSKIQYQHAHLSDSTNYLSRTRSSVLDTKLLGVLELLMIHCSRLTIEDHGQKRTKTYPAVYAQDLILHIATCEESLHSSIWLHHKCAPTACNTKARLIIPNAS